MTAVLVPTTSEIGTVMCASWFNAPSATEGALLGHTIRAFCDRAFGDEFTAHPNYRTLRDILITSMRGVALTYAFEPRTLATEPHLKTWTELAYQRLDA